MVMCRVCPHLSTSVHLLVARKWRQKFDNTTDLRVRSKSVDREKLKSAIPLEKDLLIMLDRQIHNEEKVGDED